MRGPRLPHVPLPPASARAEARIVALADVYDALCAKRPYQEALPEEEACLIIARAAGTQFDPLVYAAFERSARTFHEIRLEYAKHEEHA